MNRLSLIADIAHKMTRKNKSAPPSRAKRLIRFAIPAIALSLCVMLLSVTVITGFKSTIRNLISLVGGDVVISEYQKSYSDPDARVYFSERSLQEIEKLPGVESIRPVIQSAGIIKTDSSFFGVGVVGWDRRHNADRFAPILVEGAMPSFAQEPSLQEPSVVISSHLAQQMGVKVGEKIRLYLTNPKISVRVFRLAATIETGKSDQPMVYIPMSTLRKTMHWPEDCYSRIELFTSSNHSPEEVADLMVNHLKKNNEAAYQHLGIVTAKELHTDLYLWIDMLDSNVLVLLVLMAVVCLFTLINCLLILILDRTQSIGILKALGSRNSLIEGVFITMASRIIVQGVLWGNLAAALLSAYQYFTHSIRLDAATYYVSYVPIRVVGSQWFWVNAVTILLSLVVLVLPARIIARIQPTQAMRFE